MRRLKICSAAKPTSRYNTSVSRRRRWQVLFLYQGLWVRATSALGWFCWHGKQPAEPDTFRNGREFEDVSNFAEILEARIVCSGPSRLLY